MESLLLTDKKMEVLAALEDLTFDDKLDVLEDTITTMLNLRIKFEGQGVLEPSCHAVRNTLYYLEEAVDNMLI